MAFYEVYFFPVSIREKDQSSFHSPDTENILLSAYPVFSPNRVQKDSLFGQFNGVRVLCCTDGMQPKERQRVDFAASM